MDLHNDIATFLAGFDASLENTFAGSAAHSSTPNVYYIVVDPDQRMDNGEYSEGVCKTKISMLTISLHAKGDIEELTTAQAKIEEALAVRQQTLTEHWCQAFILQDIAKYDFKADPQGREEGIPDIVMFYRVAWRRLS